MWTCSVCHRKFKYENMSHMCSSKDIGELFIGKPDELVLLFDALVEGTSSWDPNTYGASENTVVFTSKKAWLIIKPMTKVIDVKFYHDTRLESERLHKVTAFGKKFAYHIRLSSLEQLDEEVFNLLKEGYSFSLK